MNAMSWMKGVVVAVGLSLGGSALASGPAPIVVEYQRGGSVYERQQRRADFDHEGWSDGWVNDRHDRFDRHERRMFRLGRQKIEDGQALQARGERMLERARWARSPHFARRAHRLIERGEALELEGRLLIRRARAMSM